MTSLATAPTVPVAAETVDAEAAPALEVRACAFVLGGRIFAIEVGAVREVAELDEPTVVPLAPAQVLGVASLRGQIVPVVDPSGLLGLPSHRPGRRSRVIVVTAEDLSAALVVDAVAGLEVGALRDAGTAPGVLGLLDREGTSVPLLDAEWLLAALRPTDR